MGDLNISKTGDTSHQIQWHAFTFYMVNLLQQSGGLTKNNFPPLGFGANTATA